MTCGDIIARADELEPNQYSTTLKLFWLSILDGQIIQELLLTHEIPPFAFPQIHWKDPLDRDQRPNRPPPPPPMSGMPTPPTWENRPIAWGPPEPPPPPPPDPEESDEEGEDEEQEEEEPKPPYTSPEDELIVPDPYGSQIYLHWIQAQIASENSEIVKYNQQITLYNAAYQNYCNWFNRTFMPKRPRGGNRIHF